MCSRGQNTFYMCKVSVTIEVVREIQERTKWFFIFWVENRKSCVICLTIHIRIHAQRLTKCRKATWISVLEKQCTRVTRVFLGVIFSNFMQYFEIKSEKEKSIGRKYIIWNGIKVSGDNEFKNRKKHLERSISTSVRPQSVSPHVYGRHRIQFTKLNSCFARVSWTCRLLQNAISG